MQAQAKLAKLPKKFPWIKIDVVDSIERIEDFDYYSSIEAPGNWFGIAFDWHQQWVSAVKHMKTSLLSLH